MTGSDSGYNSGLGSQEILKPTAAVMDDFLQKKSAFLHKKSTIPLDSTNQTFHQYMIRVADTKKAKLTKVNAPLIMRAVVKTDISDTSSTTMLEFPPGSMPDGNHHLRVTRSPVRPANTPGGKVEDVFFVVKMHDAKMQDPKSASDYTVLTSGSAKGGTKDNRKFITFGKPQVYGLTGNSLSLKEKIKQTGSGISIPSEAEIGQFAVYCDHKEVNLNDLPAMVSLPSDSIEAQQAQQNLQESIDHYTSQLIAMKLKKLDPRCSPIIRGNRVFVTSDKYPDGLQKLEGVQGKVIYDDTGRGSVLVEPCTAHIFQENILLSEFLIEFFGSDIASKSDESTIKRLSAALRGVKVTIASRPNQPSVQSHITSFGSHQSSDYFKGLGISSSALRYPDMLLVNIGSLEKPDYCPAELCRIVGGDGKEQIFSGKLPLTLPDEYFQPQSLVPADHPPRHKVFDIFPTRNVGGFKLFFVNLSSTSDGKTTKAVNDSVMDALKEEVGNRYGNRLADAVKESINLDATHQTLGGVLGFHNKYAANSRSVLVVVTPPGFSNSDIEKIQTECHLNYGMQCCIVDGRQATRRYHPIEKVAMVKFTGGMVREMFGKALIPAQEDPFGSEFKKTTEDRTIGIHVHDLPNNNYLVDIVSIKHNGSVRVTNNVFCAGGTKGIAAEILSSIKKDHSLHRDFKSTIVISGLGGKSKEVLDVLHTGLQQKPSPGKQIDSDYTPYFALTSIEPEHRILMAKKEQRIILKNDKNAGLSRNSTYLQCMRDHTDILASQAYNIKLPDTNKLPVALQPTSHIPSIETYVFSAFETEQQSRDGSEKHRYEVQALSTYAAPAILRLAHAASKHSRLHIYELVPSKKDTNVVKKLTPAEKKAAKAARAKAAETTVQPKLLYGIKPVHKALNDTFYFL